MSEAPKGIYSFTEPQVAAFCTVTEAKKFKRKGKETGEAKFSATFIFKPDSKDLAAAKAKAVEVFKAKFPGKELKGAKFPFANGDTEAAKRLAKLAAENKEGPKYDFLAGHICMKAASKYPVQLAIIEGGKIIDLSPEAVASHKSKFYAGVQCLAEVTFVAYEGVDAGDPDGVTAYLNTFVSLNKGDKLLGGRSAAETFKGYAGTKTDEDPTGGAGLDDEIPF